MHSLELKQHDQVFYLVNLEASIVTKISYASVRGRDNEQGAVQRVLNTRRISSIKDFALNGGSFPNSIVINWVKDNIQIDESSGTLSFDVEDASAQLIDGQHRVAGIREAIQERPEFESYELPVAVYIGLTTKACADIFLAINTEQKPVHRSLVFDLYEIADDSIVDLPAARAREIASDLNDEGGPYYRMIKFPGEEPRKGGVALSTVVSAIKPLIEPNGILDQVKISTLENQTKVFTNFFNSLKDAYGHEWLDKQNAFMYAAGFSGAVEFLGKRIVPYCVKNESFSDATIQKALSMKQESLLFQKELSGKSGTEAQKHVFNRLDELFEPGESDGNYEF